MHDLHVSLNKLLKKDESWDWTAECQESFEKTKKTLTLELFLTHYNPNLEIIVTSDVSSYGVGACILHKMTDESLASRGKKYSQIEKEALGIIFAVSKFHRYIYGRPFTLQTDDKPLLTIFGSKKKKVFLNTQPTDCRDGVQSC